MKFELQNQNQNQKYFYYAFIDPQGEIALTCGQSNHYNMRNSEKLLGAFIYFSYRFQVMNYGLEIQKKIMFALIVTGLLSIGNLATQLDH